MSNVDFGCPTILRMSGFAANWPILFWIAAVASVANLSEYFANSSTQNAFTDGSVTFATTRLR